MGKLGRIAREIRAQAREAQRATRCGGLVRKTARPTIGINECLSFLLSVFPTAFIITSSYSFPTKEGRSPLHHGTEYIETAGSFLIGLTPWTLCAPIRDISPVLGSTGLGGILLRLIVVRPPA